MMPEPPQDPLSAMGTAAASIHEMFLAYVKAGFTRPEALHMLGIMLAEMASKSAE
jgi:hypothetical protein